MRVFTGTELERMRGAQVGAMQDTCQVGAYEASTDAYGNPTATYTYGAATSCGLEHVNPKEEQRSGEVAVIDARLRLPIATTIDERDRIRVTQRYAEDTVDQVFEIEGPVQRGPSGLVLLLRLVDDGTG